MTFNEWWREHEKELADAHYAEDHWINIYQLAQKAFEAGHQSD